MSVCEFGAMRTSPVSIGQGEVKLVTLLPLHCLPTTNNGSSFNAKPELEVSSGLPSLRRKHEMTSAGMVFSINIETLRILHQNISAKGDVARGLLWRDTWAIHSFMTPKYADGRALLLSRLLPLDVQIMADQETTSRDIPAGWQIISRSCVASHVVVFTA